MPPLVMIFLAILLSVMFVTGLTGTAAIVLFCKMTLIGAYAVGVICGFRVSTLAGIAAVIIFPLTIALGLISMVDGRNAVRDLIRFLHR